MKAKWYIYTLIIGLIPFFSRLLIYIFLKEKSLEILFSASDFITLGLVINVTNINELENRNFRNDNRIWKSICIGFSIVSIIFYAILITISILESKYGDIFDGSLLLRGSIFLTFFSVIFGFSIFHRLTKIERRL